MRGCYRVILFCVCCFLGFSQDLHASRIYFLLNDIGYPETCIIPLSDPAEIALARDKAANGPGTDSWVVVKVSAGSDGINSDYYAPGRPLWSWHVSDFFGFAEITAEACQTPIFFVEDDVNYWANLPQTCFGLGVIEELTELNEYNLLVSKSGTGGGTVSSSTTGIDCGLDCVEMYLNGTTVWLTATPDPDSSFGGWTGGGCSGLGDCSVTLNTDTNVTAIFDILLPPTSSFSSSTISGAAPLIVDFADTSAYNPTSWSWNFGDGGTSTEQNPRHMYESPGTYTVSLTANNSSGSDTITMTNYISASPCPNQAVRVDVDYFDYIQSGYNSALAGDTITLEIQGVSFTEDLTFGNNVDVTLSGGNNCDYTDSAMGTKVNGSLTIIDGKVIGENIVIQ